MFSNIVVGVDGSDTSKRALRMACDLADKYGAELHLVHTPQPQTVAFAMGAVAGYGAAVTMPSNQEVQEAADKVVADCVAVAKDCGHTIKNIHCERGHPVDEVIACAEACRAELIVTGRRGLGSLGALVQGSTSQGINHHAKCACLSVV
ncbi:MAG: universal stress protein [Pseudomonadota bacterium]